MTRFLAFVLLAGTHLAGMPAQDSEGVIEVTVRDAATGRSVPGADVTLVLRQTPPPNVVTYALANGNGQIVFSGLEPGTYTVGAVKDAYVRPRAADMGEPFVLGPDALRHTVEIELTRGATISGRVLDADGIPVVEAGVQPHRTTYRQGRVVLARVAFPGNSDDERPGSLLPLSDLRQRGRCAQQLGDAPNAC